MLGDEVNTLLVKGEDWDDASTGSDKWHVFVSCVPRRCGMYVPPCVTAFQGTEGDDALRSVVMVKKADFHKDVWWSYEGKGNALSRQVRRDVLGGDVRVDGVPCVEDLPYDFPLRWRPYVCQSVMALALEIVYMSRNWTCLVQDDHVRPLSVRVVLDSVGRSVYHYQASKWMTFHCSSSGKTSALNVLIEASEQSDFVSIRYVMTGSYV